MLDYIGMKQLTSGCLNNKGCDSIQGNKKIIDLLNQNLANELTAIHQYIVHAGIVANWGYNDLSDYIMDRAKGEMKHTDMLIDRILFLEGFPEVTKLNPIYK